MKKILLCAIALAALLLATTATVAADAPPLAPPPAPEVAVVGQTISGLVWQDFCVTDCTAGSGLRRGNGLPDEAEKRLSGVTVGLGYGYCRYSRPFRYATTDAQGAYKFTGLSSGTYCVTVNSRQSNTAFPKPGVWTRPSGRSPWYIASYTVRIWGFGRGYLYFAWDKNP